MTGLNIYELSNIDPDDISEVLLKIEKSFEFKFGETDLTGIKTFGEFYDIVTSMVQGENFNDCTTQQAFYKLRNAIVHTLSVDECIISPDTALEQLFPKQTRRIQIAAIDNILGIKTKIIRPKYWITVALDLTLIVSFIGLFIFWELTLPVLLFSIIGLNLSNKYGNQLDLQNVGQLTEKIAREHYKQVRSTNGTINRHEIVQKIRALFMHELGLEETALTREAKFG